MNEFERAQQRARELDILHPNFIHMVGIRCQIVRVKKPEDELEEPNGTITKENR